VNQHLDNDNPSDIEPSVNKSNALMDWLKSPLGSTFTTAMTIGLVATVGVYVMNQMDMQRSEKEKEKFLQSLQTDYDQQAYVQCFESAEEKLEEENHAIEAKTLVEYIGVCRYEAAKQKAKILNYSEALEILAAIPDNYEYYTQVEIQKEKWSREIVTKARNLYQEEGNLEAASKEIDTIPSSPIREAALINLSEWQKEYERNSALINEATRDLEYGYCTSAIETAGTISGSNYWLLEGKKILDKAQKCLEEQIEAQQDNQNPSLGNNPIIVDPNPGVEPTPPINDNPNNKVIDLCPGPLCPD
jgi:serine/threonine-protein kinase